eukprot:CAMPEP_0174367360 /NCGR_PEP_ID=MMETSP0811_2-20130205/84940_1 /TAXON_ID=73025 ORGANISM="Eutreptiella gymnastica-like, Strain CCMP1594" /NCGR_SAMPLE_ID=MMETSP0811_2 /ASSEMBLY_ACC=CAM_ASM_000667 /LENGTH=98 /DNA_ID=CAMNT_0015509851 /DNA_START=1133 /DNA_END=1426 /DNA_ORIENTATION=-
MPYWSISTAAAPDIPSCAQKHDSHKTHPHGLYLQPAAALTLLLPFSTASKLLFTSKWLNLKIWDQIMGTIQTVRTPSNEGVLGQGGGCGYEDHGGGKR